MKIAVKGIVALSLAATITGGVIGFNYFTEAYAEKPSYAASESESKYVNEVISEMHEYFNELVCYGRINKFKPSYKTDSETVKEYNDAWRAFTGEGTTNGEYFDLIPKVEKAISATPNEKLKKDLKTAKAFFFM